MKWLKLLWRYFLSFMLACFILIVTVIPIAVRLGIDVEKPELWSCSLVFLASTVILLIFINEKNSMEKEKKKLNEHIKDKIVNPLILKQQDDQRKAFELVNKCKENEYFPDYVHKKEKINKVLHKISEHNCNMIGIGTWFAGNEVIYFATINKNHSVVYSGYSVIKIDPLHKANYRLLLCHLVEKNYPDRFVYGRVREIILYGDESFKADIVYMTPGLLDSYIKKYHQSDMKEKASRYEQKKKEKRQYMAERSKDIPI